MAEFLASTGHIISRIEEIFSQAKEFIYMLSPKVSQMPKDVSTKFWDAQRRGVRVMLVYRTTTVTDDSEMLSPQNGRFGIFCHPNLNTIAYLNEKEAVLSSCNLFDPSAETTIEFGVHLRKAYAAGTYDELLSEFRRILGQASKMVLDDGKLVSAEALYEQRPKPPEPERDDAAPPLSTKILTIKEKQDFLRKLFARECKDCTIKVEDAERLRLYGKGIVLALSDERVDVIFVHYETYQSRIDEIKQFIGSKHPDLKVWFQYNRINIRLQREPEIAEVFFTLREAIASFNLL